MAEAGYGKRPIWQWIVIYLVIGIVVYGLIYYFFLSKKGTNPYNSSPPSYISPSGEVSPNVAVTKSMTVDLSEENKSGESGTAALNEENGKTTVTLSLTGFEKDVAQPAHIHVGVCPGVGAVKYPLTSVVNGSSVTILPVTLDELKQNLPLAINVHKSPSEVSTYTSCGELSSK